MQKEFIKQRQEKFQDYLGDGVYVDFDGHHIVMTANGIGPAATDTIHLDPDVVESFSKYLGRLDSILAKEGTASE